MATQVDDDTDSFFGRSNRRRCVKGRTSYIEPSELTIDDKANSDLNNAKNFNECAYEENIEVDDGDDEPITIDLSEFLNAHPAITETPTENVIDASAGLSDCHSQFRVTSSLSDASTIPIPDLSSLKPTIKVENAHPVEMPSPVPESASLVLVENGFNKTPSSVEETCSKENNQTKMISTPGKVISVKTVNLPKSVQKYKSLSKTKDFNETNARVFGKYPVIQCEKLDIENFVKKNNIKVRNWPLSHVNNYQKTKNHAVKTVNLNRKSSPQNTKAVPRLFNKPISFNRLNSFSPSGSAANKVTSILVNSLESPQIAFSHNQLIDGVNSRKMPQIFSLNKKPNVVTTKQIVKLVGHKVTVSPANQQKYKSPVIASINKVPEGSQLSQFVSPKTIKFDGTKSSPVTPILPKPNIQTIYMKDYTVIQPYFEDPISPVKPKPLLTVPIDIVQTVDPDPLTSSPKTVKFSPQKATKKFNSVFLNGAIKKISSPKKAERRHSVLGDDFGQNNNVVSLTKLGNSVEPEIKDHSSVMKARSSIVSAMKSVLTKPQPKKISRPRQNLSKDNAPPVDSSVIGCNAYNSTLNDIIFGFDDFAEDNFAYSSVNNSEEALCTPIESEFECFDAISSDQTISIGNGNIKIESISEESDRNFVSRKDKRKKKSIQSPHDSDTLTASEGEDDSNQVRMSYTPPKRKQRKIKPSNIKHEVECDMVETSSESVFNKISNVVNPPITNELDTPCTIDDSSILTSETSTNLTIVEIPNVENLSSTKESKTRLSESPAKIKSNLISTRKVKGRNIKKISTKQLMSVKQKHTGVRYMHSKFKTKMKKTLKRKPVSKKRRMSSKPADIIEEIKTITGGLVPENNKKGKNKHVENNKEDVDLANCDVNSKAQSLTKRSKRKKDSLIVPKTKKKLQTLQVSFTRTTRKRSKSLGTQLAEDSSLSQINDKKTLKSSNENNSILTDNHNANSLCTELEGSPIEKTRDSIADETNISHNKAEDALNHKIKDSLKDKVKNVLDNKVEDILQGKENLENDDAEASHQNQEEHLLSDKEGALKTSTLENIQLDKICDVSDIGSASNNNVDSIKTVSVAKSSLQIKNTSICEVDIEVPNAKGTIEANSKSDISIETNNDEETKELGDSKIENTPEKEQATSTTDIKKTSKSKKCPKLKISVTKPLQSSSLGRNWYVSERKDSTDSVLSEEIVSKQNKSNTDKCRLISQTDKGTNVITDAVANVEMNKSFAHVLLSDHKVSNIENASNLISTSENNVSINNATNTSMSREMLLGALFVPPVKIKEEPVDIEDEPMEYGDSAASTHVKLENVLVSGPFNVSENTKSSRRRTSFNSTGKKSINIEDSDNNEKENSITTTKNKSKRKSCASAAQLYAKAQLSSIKSSPKVSAVKCSPKPTVVKTSPKVPTIKGSPQIAQIKSSIKMEKNSPKFVKKTYSIEAVTLPFSQGWMRELVHRSTEETAGKKQCDVYYFAPEGNKLRSMPDISNYLSKHPECTLTAVNFTYAKDLIYREPFEIERGAKFKSSLSALCKENPKKILKKKQTPSSHKITPFLTKKKTPAKSSPDIKCQSSCNNSTLDESIENTINDSKSRFSRKKIKNVPFDNSCGESTTAKKSKKGTTTPSTEIDSSNSANDKTGETVINQSLSSGKIATTPKLTQNKTKKKTVADKTSKSKKVSTKNVSNLQTLCSHRCLSAPFQTASVQCTVCLCLFHPNCVPLMSKQLKFACKSCTAAKLEYYESIRQLPGTPSADCTEEPVTEIVNHLDVSLLYPETVLDVPHEANPCQLPIISNPQTSTPYMIPPNPTGCLNMNSSMNYFYLRNTSLQSPQLLSHLLQSKSPQAASYSTVPAPYPMTQVLPTSPGGQLRQKCIRVRLPADGGPIMLPNSLMIKRLPDRRIMVCSTANVPGLQHTNFKIIKNYNVPNSSPGLLPMPGSMHRTPSFAVAAPPNMSAVNPVASPLSSLSSMIDRRLSSGENDRTTIQVLDNSSENNSMPLPNPQNESTDEVSESLWDLSRLRKSCDCLNLIFRRLNVCDLLRARQVCCSWKQLASQRFLWKKVSLEGLMVTDWKKCCLSLLARGTKSLDLSGVIHPDVEKPWENLESSVIHLSGIEELVFDQIPPSLLKAVITHLTQLRRLECHFVTPACTEPEVWLTPCQIELSPLQSLSKLVRLKIGSGGGILLQSGSSFVMPHLPNLRHVALTGFNFHSHFNLEFLSQQKDLISLELGDCVGIEPEIYSLLGKLTMLKSLRLENGGSINDLKFAEALSEIKGLEVLELMNFRISSMLSDSFKNLKQLIHVNIWPDNILEEALVNQNFYNALSNIRDLKYVCWGVIAESDSVPDKLKLKDCGKGGVKNELTFEELFKNLVSLFPECRVEVKCVPRKLWREFCSTRK